MSNHKICLSDSINNATTCPQAQGCTSAIDRASDVFIHTYKIDEDGSGRAFILRIPIEIKSPDHALENFLQLSQRYILHKLIEEDFLVFGASISHLTSEHTSVDEYFKQEHLSKYSSIDDVYCDLLLAEWELREIAYH
jgi:hypothetical protein